MFKFENIAVTLNNSTFPIMPWSFCSRSTQMLPQRINASESPLDGVTTYDIDPDSESRTYRAIIEQSQGGRVRYAVNNPGASVASKCVY